MRRRKFIALLGSAAIGLPLVARAQSMRTIPKVGWLKIQSAQHTPDQLQAFQEGMKALGLIEGRDYVIEERYADGNGSRLQGLTAELLDAGVTIILATSQPSIAAAARVTKAVPVIGRVVDDPVADGMAQSLARPGGNITGIYTMTEELNAKRLSLLKEAVPLNAPRWGAAPARFSKCQNRRSRLAGCTSGSATARPRPNRFQRPFGR